MEDLEDDSQTLGLPLACTGDELLQGVPLASLPGNEEPYHIPEPVMSSQHYNFTECFQKPEGFGTREELQAWCLAIGRANNFQIICKSSQMKNTLGNGQGSRIQLCCERSGHYTSHRAKNYVPKTTITKNRKCGTIKCNCPFRLNGSCDKYGKWKLRVGCGYHNHMLPTTLVGHGYAGRLQEKEKLEVEKLTEAGCRPREILTTIKKDNSNNRSTLRTIYNARRKLKVYAMQGRSMMQHFLKIAQEHHYTIEYKYDPLTNKVTDLFFAHPVSVKLAQCFHEFLILDCTYKTNKYKLPLFHIVSHTSTGATFTVGVAFMSREKEVNYIWALECVKRLYRENTIPSVFVTDCEVGLISAIHHVFPKSSHLLCAWHIGKNVYAHGQKYFQLKFTSANDKDKPKKIDTVITQKEVKGKQKEKQQEKKNELKKWYDEWKDVIMSPSVEEYEANLKKFVSTWEPTHKDAVRYVTDTWLAPYKEKFVSAWTNKIKHYDNVATSRVESAHAKLKLYLGNSRGNFVNCFLRAHCSYENEHVHVEAEFERSKTRQMQEHRVDNLFQEILNFVSIKALQIVFNEIPRNVDMDCMDVDMKCECLARTINGLPCACEIRALKNVGKVIPLDIIDPFWRQLSSSPPSPNRTTLLLEETPEFLAIRDAWERGTENVRIRMLAQLQPIAFPCTINLQEPEVCEVNKGRKTKKQLLKDRSCVRESSFYENINKVVDVLEKMGKKRNREELAAERKESNSVDPVYLECMPLVMQKFIAATQEMPKDGNCGYHVLLKQLTMKVSHHNPCRYLREVMIGNIERHRIMYEEMWGVDLLEELKDDIDNNKWMKMPESGFIIAEAFTTIVVYLSREQSITIVPTTMQAYPNILKNMVVMGFVNNNHFIGLKLKRCSPLPSLPRFSYWQKQKNKSNFSDNWSAPYMKRIKKYEDMVGTTEIKTVCLVDC